MAPEDVAELTETLLGLGVREHVLQEVRSEGARPVYVEKLAAVQGRAGILTVESRASAMAV
jgi:hypothetical protein